MLLTEFLQLQVNEAVKSTEVDKVRKLFAQYLKKKGIIMCDYHLETTVNGKKNISIIVRNDKYFAIISWAITNTAEISTIDFGEGNVSDVIDSWIDGKPIKTISCIEPNGSSHTQCLKIIELGLNGGVNVAQLKKAIEKSRIYEANLENRHIVEGLDEYLSGKQKPGESELDFLVRMRGNLSTTVQGWKKDGGPKYDEYSDMLSELRDRIAQLRANVRSGNTIKAVIEAPGEEDLMRATPEERFGDMVSYIQSVIKGLRVLALICGAPGIGKSFRVRREIKKTHRYLDDYCEIKGRCSAPALFMKLWEYRKPGQILLFDDVDDVFRDDAAINLLKAAYDSSDERYVSWIVSKPIPMDPGLGELNPDDAVYDEDRNQWFYPRTFEYKGSGIICTNYRAGQIDTAVRNRAVIADLDFTVEESLQLIESVIPHIMPGVVSDETKQTALGYLRKLAKSGADVDVSIRSFMHCAKEYANGGDEAGIHRRIAEQMRLQSARGGKKY